MAVHRGWDRRWGRCREVSRELLSDPMGRCEVSNVPASTHPLLASICRGTCYWLCVGGWGHDWAHTHARGVPPFPPKWRTTDISVFEALLKIVHKPQSRQQVQREEILWFQSNIQQGKKSSQWKYEVWEIEMCTSSLLTETVGCLKIFWTPAMRKLWLELPLDFEMHPCHCTHGTVLFYSSLCWPATKLCHTRSTVPGIIRTVLKDDKNSQWVSWRLYTLSKVFFLVSLLQSNTVF